MSNFMGVGIFWIGLNRADLGCWRLTLNPVELNNRIFPLQLFWNDKQRFVFAMSKILRLFDEIFSHQHLQSFQIRFCGLDQCPYWILRHQISVTYSKPYQCIPPLSHLRWPLRHLFEYTGGGHIARGHLSSRSRKLQRAWFTFRLPSNWSSLCSRLFILWSWSSNVLIILCSSCLTASVDCSVNILLPCQELQKFLQVPLYVFVWWHNYGCFPSLRSCCGHKYLIRGTITILLQYHSLFIDIEQSPLSMFLLFSTWFVFS